MYGATHSLEMLGIMRRHSWLAVYRQASDLSQKTWRRSGDGRPCTRLWTWRPGWYIHMGRVCWQVGQLRAERARYERALRRELGEEVPLARALDEASDWRGRAQQISLLQERLLSLQESQAGLATIACDAALPSEP